MSRHQEQARDDFDRVYHRAVLRDLLARLCRRPTGLLAYQEARRGLIVAAESCRGLRTVPVDRIVGSTDRCRDFDGAFRPLRSEAIGRWVSVARAHGEGRSLPPVELYQIGDAYFVRDGHHRVSVARVRGQPVIDAEVVEVVGQPLIRLASEAGPLGIVTPGIVGALRNQCLRALVIGRGTTSRGRRPGLT